MSREHSSVPRMRAIADVRLSDDLANEAADVLRQAFAGDVRPLACVPGVYPTSIYRARAGERRTNPLFRIALWMLAARRAGLPRSVAQLCVDWLEAVIDRLWSDGEPVTVADASVREQLTESEETACQVAYAHGDRSVRARWIEQLRRERAIEAELIAALEAEEKAQRRRAA